MEGHNSHEPGERVPEGPRSPDIGHLHLRRHYNIGHTTIQLECSVTPQQEQATSPREWPDDYTPP